MKTLKLSPKKKVKELYPVSVPKNCDVQQNLNILV